MKRIMVWYAMFWYAVITFYIYEICNGTWELFMIDVINLFSDSEERYEIGVLGISIIILLLIISTCMIVKRIKIIIVVKLKNREVKRYNFIDELKRYQLVLWGGVICIVIFNYFYFYSQGKNEDKVWEKYTTVAHAGGIIDEYAYSNCEDAIISNYKKGHRIFEIDFMLTSDDKIVGKHDWDKHIIQEGMAPGYIPSEKEFLEKPLWGKYTPLTFERLCKVMDEYEDIWIITDTKYEDAEYNKKFFGEMVETAKRLELEEILDRVIIQVYSEGMKDVVEGVYSFDSYIFTLYQLEFKGDETEFLRYVRHSKKNNIDAVTMEGKRLSPELIEIADRYGIKVYVHTINEVEEAQEALKWGVQGVYTDVLTPNVLIKEEE